MSLRRLHKQHQSTDKGFGTFSKNTYSPGYHVVRYKRVGYGMTEHHCYASSARIAKKRLDECLRGEL